MNRPSADISVVPARADWLEALTEGDDVFTSRFGLAVEQDWIGFPESLPFALDGARRRPDDPWGTHLFFDRADGALVGVGGFKGPPHDRVAEIGYAVAPARQGRGIASCAVSVFVERARVAGLATITAHTLATENASTAVLRKSGFHQTAELPDDELGAIWRWELELTPADQRTLGRPTEACRSCSGRSCPPSDG